ncbi:unnamed protein product [Candida verbasci]|uniref:Checkpoint protein n=1 Tax=Candida verbasci TaxID=1227364 RepID=A0A9W4TU54_9ASCO|nr:unnamed protein product [Candida verbasci]
MKLKLTIKDTEKLKDSLQLISSARKFVVLKFTPKELCIISINDQVINQEPQIWIKFPADSLFESIEVQSLRENTISMELNIDLLLQTLKNFKKANSEGLNIRLQRTDTSGQQGVNSKNGRTASLALFYSNMNINSNTLNHTFRIPVKILRENQNLLQEPYHSQNSLIMRLPREFVTMFKRLEKFKKASGNDIVTIRASRTGNGFLGFILQEENKFRVTISWNNRLEVHKSTNNEPESVRETLKNINSSQMESSEEESVDEVQLTLKLNHWQQASKIVGGCEIVILYINDNECSFHCLFDDTGEVEILYFVNGIRVIT